MDLFERGLIKFIRYLRDVVLYLKLLCKGPFYKDLKVKGNGNGKSHIRPVHWGVPVRGDNCPGPSAL